MDQASGLVSGSTAWESMLMECDRHGHVLWMNRPARARLGPMESLFRALPALDLPKVTLFLTSRDPGRRPTLTSTVQVADRPARVPVRLVRLLALENRVVLSAEMRARASDSLPSRHQIGQSLLELQTRTVRNYFRLQQAHGLLESRRRPSRSLGVMVTETLENERTRIARELHSGAGQTLAGIKVNLDLMEARMPNPPEAVLIGLARIRALCDQALSEIRYVSQRLHPPDWQRLDLREALELLWNQTGIPEKFHATLEIHPLESDLPDAVRFAVYRAAQEGLSNVLRHSSASEVKLELDQRNDCLHLALQDNGAGFDADEVSNGDRALVQRGIGLRAMREEILALSGQFQLTSGAEGTRLEISVPITENR